MFGLIRVSYVRHCGESPALSYTQPSTPSLLVSSREYLLARFSVCPERGLIGWSDENLVSVGGYN
jgi:hypothetical protein